MHIFSHLLVCALSAGHELALFYVLGIIDAHEDDYKNVLSGAGVFGALVDMLIGAFYNAVALDLGTRSVRTSVRIHGARCAGSDPPDRDRGVISGRSVGPDLESRSVGIEIQEPTFPISCL